MELLAGLEPATYCFPKKMRYKSPSQRVRLFSGAPLFNPRSDGSDADNKRKQKSARKRAPFCLELLAGLEPATC